MGDIIMMNTQMTAGQGQRPAFGALTARTSQRTTDVVHARKADMSYTADHILEKLMAKMQNKSEVESPVNKNFNLEC